MAEQKTVTFIIERQDGPNEKPYTQEFDVPYRPALNVVAALMEIQKNPVTRDGKRVAPVVWECNCLEKVCGACMMVINGQAKQACCALVEELEQPIHLAPARTFPVIRDLLIDRTSMFESLKKIQGWINVDGSWKVHEAPRQNPNTAATAYEISHCMTCQAETLGSADAKGRHNQLRQQPKLRPRLPEEHQADDLPRPAQSRCEYPGNQEYLQQLIKVRQMPLRLSDGGAFFSWQNLVFLHKSFTMT